MESETRTIIPKEKCLGCGMCVSSCPQQCIDMQADREGFLYPLINQDKCISCGICEAACPVLKQVEKTQNKAVFAAKNTCETAREESSSGGVFISLAKRIIDMGGAVCAARYDEAFGVCHQIVNNKDGLHSLCGAKYSQSRFDQCYEDIRKRLQKGQWVLFVGTPCQVMALSVNLTDDEKKHLLLVDFICHGVPSPLILSRYLNELSRDHSKGNPVASINMRSKLSGWSRYSYCMEVKFAKGYSYQKHGGEDAFLRGFVNNLYLRESCEQCNYKGTNRASDITLGDCWGIWDIAPEFDDNKGTSLVIVHTEKGQEAWNAVSGGFDTIVLSEEQAFSQNPSALVSSVPHVNKSRFWELINNGKDVSEAVTIALENKAISNTVFNRVKNRIKKTLFRKG